MREGMHNCRKFREDWSVGLAEETPECQDCRSFCEEAALALEAVDGAGEPIGEFSDDYWNRFDDRLRDRLLLTRPSSVSVVWKWAVVAAAASVVILVSWAERPARVTTPPGHIEFVDDHIRGLDE